MPRWLKLYEGLGINLKILTIKIRYFTQLFLSYILLLLVATIGISLFTLSFAKDYVENQAIQNLSYQLTYIEHLMQYSNETDALATIRESREVEHDDARLTVIDPQGHVLFDSEQDPHGMDNHIRRPEVELAIQKTMGWAIRYSDTIQKSLVYVAKQSSNGTIYRLAVPIDYLRHELGSLKKKIGAYTVAIFLFCLLLTFLMSHWIASPLNWTLQSLRKIKHRQFDQLNPKPSFVKEINNVNESLMDVSKNIDAFIQKISKEKEKKDVVLNNMINGLIVLDVNMDIILMNKAAFILFFNLNQTNLTIQLTHYPDVFSFAQDLMNNFDVEPIEIEHANGRTILISGSIYSEGKEPRGILTAQDITKLKRLESTRQNFVANVSHELKTPITFIKSMFETLIASREKNIEISLDLVKKGVVHTDRLTQIIDDLLQLSKLETTGGEIEKTAIDLNEVIQIVFQDCLYQAQKKSISLISKNKETIVHANENLLEQALKNLVENAIKYSAENTQILILVQQSDDRIDIQVIDQGPGIPEQHIGKLFQRFYRVDTARSREMGGTGLGLAIVKHIAQSHGGQASVESIIGKGSIFTISLPK